MSEKADMADNIRLHMGGTIPAGTPAPKLFLTASGVPSTLRLKGSGHISGDLVVHGHRPLPPIGLSGFGGAGKTEAAKFIERNIGYERRHIAEPLRRMLASLMREYGMSDELIERYLTGDLKENVVPAFGVTSRHLQITLGTEWGREQVDQSIWAKLWSHQAATAQMLGGKPAMNDSVRFPNEEESIREIGGITIMIVRPGTGPVAYKWKRLGPVLYRWFGCMWGVHDSERVDRLKPDYIVTNDGTIDELHVKVDVAIDRARRGLAPVAL